MNIQEIYNFTQKHKAMFLDIKFIDLVGRWKHITLPVSRFDATLCAEGLFFDGSSIEGWQPIHASDMLLMPDLTTLRMDPFCTYPTVSVIASVLDPHTRAPYSRDPRHVAKKAEAYLAHTGIADTVFMGPEAEFFVFDDVRFDHSQPYTGYYALNSSEGAWNTGKHESPNLGHQIPYKGGYLPVPPTDHLVSLRQEMMKVLEETGIEVEVGHHEVATGGQCEIGIRYAQLSPCADRLMWFKYVIKNVAHQHGKTVTFMPKPLFGDNGSGMHCHQSLWKAGEPLFAGDLYAGLSPLALHYIGGIIKHAKAIAAFTNPSTNSYRRLVPGFEAPVNLVYSSRNRSASIRIPCTGLSPKSKRIEVRFPDATCNPYLGFAAMLMAGIDGIQNKIDPGNPCEEDLYHSTKEELRSIPSMPGSLEESLVALEQDHDFLLQGGVFTKDLLNTWIEQKRVNEVDPVRMRPTPHEFSLYFDA